MPTLNWTTEERRDYDLSPRGIKHRWQMKLNQYNKYSPSRIARGIHFSLTPEEFFVLVKGGSINGFTFSGCCEYGGSRDGDPGRMDNDAVILAPDRVDNRRGYTLDNVVAACSFHNTLRADEFTVEQMKEILNQCPLLRQCGLSAQAKRKQLTSVYRKPYGIKDSQVS